MLHLSIFFEAFFISICLFLQHPGGQDVIYECLGLDATNAFRSAGHSEHAFDMLDLHCPLVGILPKNERMWNKKLRY